VAENGGKEVVERLTKRNKNGDAYYPGCFAVECNEKECQTCDFDTQICERLASYEDLGVTPEQIREMDRAYLEKCEEVNRLRAELDEVRKHGA